MAPSNVVELNVGGEFYATSLGTLTKYPESMLASMFQSEWSPAQVDSAGRYFIDRDGRVFSDILAFLRDGEATLLPQDLRRLQQLHHEANYYGLVELMALIRAELQAQVARTCLSFTATVVHDSQGPRTVLQVRFDPTDQRALEREAADLHHQLDLRKPGVQTHIMEELAKRDIQNIVEAMLRMRGPGVKRVTALAGGNSVILEREVAPAEHPATYALAALVGQGSG